jgi:ubiquinone/menaquinone biosynthesis C-methylase UbiE
MGFIHSFAMQVRKPEGILGKFLVPIMNSLNRQLYDWTIDLLDIKPTDRVLELGFGPGNGIRKMAAIATEGLVAGVDFSELMVRRSQKRYATQISAGRVDVKHGDVSSLPYDDQSFNKVIAVQLIYFCQPPNVFLEESRRVLRPGGRIALSFVAKEDMAKLKFTKTGVFTLYTGQDVSKLLTEAGFTHAHFEAKPVRTVLAICALAES